MAFLSDIFGRMGRVARGQANAGVDAMEDATFEATVKIRYNAPGAPATAAAKSAWVTRKAVS
jgi:hypothetical protein